MKFELFCTKETFNRMNLKISFFLPLIFVAFSSPKNNFLAKFYLLRATRQTVENISFWARFWSQKSPEIDFPLFLRSKPQKEPKTRFGRKSAKFCENGYFFLLRRRSFCANRENPSVANAFLGVLKPIFTLFALFHSLSLFFVQSYFEGKNQF